MARDLIEDRIAALFGDRTIDESGGYETYRVWSVPEVSFVMDGPLWVWAWDEGCFFGSTINSTDPKYYYAFRHPGNRANVLYFDGHVSSYSVRDYTASGYVWNWKYP